MTPLNELKHFYSPTGRLIIAAAYCNNISQKEIFSLKKWAKKNGWTIKRTYKEESQRRAFTLVKDNYSMLCINRVTTAKKDQNKNGHLRGDDSVILHCNVACFINGINLGQFGIHWNDFMEGDAELLVHLRVPKYVSMAVR